MSTEHRTGQSPGPGQPAARKQPDLSRRSVIRGAAGLAGAGLWLALSLTVWLAGRALLRRLPGLTGDTYGALAELAELVSLILTPPLVRLLGTATPFS